MTNETCETESEAAAGMLIKRRTSSIIRDFCFFGKEDRLAVSRARGHATRDASLQCCHEADRGKEV